MKNILVGLVCVSAILSTGCANRGIVLSSPNITLERSEIMPTNEQLSGAKTKVVIFKPDDGQIQLAQNASLGHTLSTELSKHISQTGAEIVDRNIAKQLGDELLLAEARGLSNYDGPKVADYAINGSISTAHVGASFSESYTWKDKKGKYHTTPAKCKYTGTVSAQFKIYKMTPKLSYLETVNIEDSVSSSQETRSSSCSMGASQQQGMISQAAISAVKDARLEFQNYFAPKAYILEAKQNDDRIVFKLSGGTNDGFKEGSDITIYSSAIARNAISGEESIEEIEITEALMSDKIGKNYAWIIIEDAEVAKNIKLGDYAKLKYEKSFFEF